MCVRHNSPDISNLRPSGSACEAGHEGPLLSGQDLGGQGGVGLIRMASCSAVPGGTARAAFRKLWTFDRGQGAWTIGGFDRLAGAGGDIAPGIALIVDGRGTGARRTGPGGAIIFAGQCNAVAMLGGRGGYRQSCICSGCGESQSQCGSSDRGDFRLRFHGSPLFDNQGVIIANAPTTCSISQRRDKRLHSAEIPLPQSKM